MARYEIKFYRVQQTSIVMDAENEHEASYIADELLASDFYNVIDERMMDPFEPDTYAEVGLADSDDGYMGPDELALYL